MTLITTVVMLMVAVIVGVVAVLPVVRNTLNPWVNDSNHSVGRGSTFTGILGTVTAPIPILFAVVLIVAIAQVMG